MKHLLIPFVVFALGQTSDLPLRPHSEYGVPLVYQAKTPNNYEVSNEVLPIEETALVFSPYDSYGIPKPFKDYGAPNQPQNEYAVPVVQKVPPALTNYDYAIPHIVPHAQEVTPVVTYNDHKEGEYVAPLKPHDEYGVPQVPHDDYGIPHVQEVAPVVTSYEYTIPHAKPVVVPSAEYAVVGQEPHNEYGVPHVQEVTPVVTNNDHKEGEYVAPLKPHDEYGVPQVPHDDYGIPHVQEVAPVVTSYEYTIPHAKPVVVSSAEYAVVGQEPHNEYGVPHVQEVTPVVNNNDHKKGEYVAPLKPHGEYVAPLKPHDEYGVPQEPHDDYGISHIQEVEPVVTSYEYTIPHAKPVVAPSAEYAVVGQEPHNEYGVPHVQEVTSVVTNDDHKEGEYVAPLKPHGEYGVPQEPHDDYGISHIQEVAPVVTSYEYTIPHTEPVVIPAPAYGIPLEPHGEYDIPQAPYAGYGVPHVQKGVAVPHYDYSVFNLIAPNIKLRVPESLQNDFGVFHANKQKFFNVMPSIQDLKFFKQPEVVPHTVYGVPIL